MNRFESHSLRKAGVVTLVFVIIGCFAAAAFSASGIYNTWPANTCQTTNCGSASFVAVYYQKIPFTIDVWAGSNECLRIDPPTSKSVDLQITVISPTGEIFTSDDRSQTDLRPLIKIDPTVNGAYSATIVEKSGKNVDFRLRVGNYATGNVNCKNPTQPLGAQ